MNIMKGDQQRCFTSVVPVFDCDSYTLWLITYSGCQIQRCQQKWCKVLFECVVSKDPSKYNEHKHNNTEYSMESRQSPLGWDLEFESDTECTHSFIAFRYAKCYIHIILLKRKNEKIPKGEKRDLNDCESLFLTFLVHCHGLK